MRANSSAVIISLLQPSLIDLSHRPPTWIAVRQARTCGWRFLFQRWTKKSGYTEGLGSANLACSEGAQENSPGQLTRAPGLMSCSNARLEERSSLKPPQRSHPSEYLGLTSSYHACLGDDY
jgi:hypothetical protein